MKTPNGSLGNVAWARWAVLGAILAWGTPTALGVWGCAGALPTAPLGTVMTLSPNPSFIPAHGGVSVITAVLVEPAGTPVSDGTVVQFFTTLGRIDREGRTRDGMARVNLVSDSRSGEAVVTAVSGGDAPAPTPSASPTTAPSASPTSTLLRTGRASGAEASAAKAVRADASTTVMIGNPNVVAIHVRADPPRITISNSTHIIATVLGPDGNPIPNVAVFFQANSLPGTTPPTTTPPPPTTTPTSTTSTTTPTPPTTIPGGLPNPSTEFMDSQGRPVYTNQNGEAEDVMRTRRPTQGEAEVIARVAGAGGFIVGRVRIPIL
jgi:hypothetical protein